MEGFNNFTRENSEIMKMKRVLAEKINRKHQPIYTIAFDATVMDAAKMMHKEKIGAMLVNMPVREDGVYAGILSERDIISSCASYSNFETLPVSKIMSTKLITTDMENSAAAVVTSMRKNHMRHIPLSENGKIVAVEFKKCLKVIDMEGKFNPIYDESKTIRVECTNLLIAVGQSFNWGKLLI